jgi:ribosomal-protein-alanine N-acetyltransferase
VAGFINFWVICDVIELNNFAIHENFRGKGFGKAFLMFLIECGNILDVKRIFLEVKKNNFKALSLYKKFKFYVTGIRKRYYSDGNDAILMERIL